MKISATRMMLGSRKPNAYQPLPPATPPGREERVARAVGRGTLAGTSKAIGELESLATTPLQALSPASGLLTSRCANHESDPYDTARLGGGNDTALVGGS